MIKFNTCFDNVIPQNPLSKPPPQMTKNFPNLGGGLDNGYKIL